MRGARGRRARPDSPVNITISKDGSAVGQPGCSHSSCAWVRTVGTGLSPNTTYTVTCRSNAGTPFSATQVTTDGNGRLTDRSCYFGFPGYDFWVTVGPHESNHISW